jgi:hypothetical protein
VLFYCSTNIFTPGDQISPQGANFKAGSISTIVSYDDNVVKKYNTTGSLVRFKNKNIFFYLQKRFSLIQRQRCT